MSRTSNRLPTRPLCYVRKGGSVVETCTNTTNSLPLLRPDPEANERIFGALGRAAEYYGIDIHAFGFLSTHYHLIYSVKNALQMSRFQSHLNSNIAREIGRLHGWRDKFWARRYRNMGIGDDRADQRARLKYCLAQATQAGLVASPLDWPAPTAASALLDRQPIVGYWFNRTKEYHARRSGIDFAKYDYATRYEITLQPLPAFLEDSPEEYQAMIVQVLAEIESEAAQSRGLRPVKGADSILAQDPTQPLSKQRKKSPAPMLFFSRCPEARKAMSDEYKVFRNDYMLGSELLIKAAERGYRLEPGRALPNDSFPPVSLQRILSSKGFDPQAAFPAGCFPRAWPFLGGELPPYPRTPPSRNLLLEQVSGRLKIVHRGEIPTVRVPLRASEKSLIRVERLRAGSLLPGKRASPGEWGSDPP